MFEVFHGEAPIHLLTAKSNVSVDQSLELAILDDPSVLPHISDVSPHTLFVYPEALPPPFLTSFLTLLPSDFRLFQLQLTHFVSYLMLISYSHDFSSA
jgi:hypothetical protein